MPLVDSIPASEQAKTVHALDRAATVSGHLYIVFFFSVVLLAHSGSRPFVQFRNFFTDCRTPWANDQLGARPVPEHRTTQNRVNAYTANIHALSGI
jgi:hypothetical protein